MHTNTLMYSLLIRYGRVGEDGVMTLKDFNSESGATDEFERIFKSKTGVNWNDRFPFVPKINKYRLVDMNTAESLAPPAMKMIVAASSAGVVPPHTHTHLLVLCSHFQPKLVAAVW